MNVPDVINLQKSNRNGFHRHHVQNDEDSRNQKNRFLQKPTSTSKNEQSANAISRPRNPGFFHDDRMFDSGENVGNNELNLKRNYGQRRTITTKNDQVFYFRFDAFFVVYTDNLD